MSSALRSVDETALFEVATTSADTLRARLAVGGQLTAETAPLLASALTTHLSAGRRYLRVDLAAVTAADAEALDTLTTAHDSARAVGGMLILEGTSAGSVLGAHAATLRRHV